MRRQPPRGQFVGMHALLVALILSQTIYEWTDSNGVQHFTDDASQVPKSARVRTTTGSEVTVVPATKRDASTPVVVTPKPPASDTCDAALAKQKDLEKQRDAVKADAPRLRDAESVRCHELLATQGQGGFARCAAGVEARVTEQLAVKEKALTQQLEATKDELRKAQLSGCR